MGAAEILPTGETRHPTPREGRIHRLLKFLRRHPVVCLLLLTPGIPEYLSSSSSLAVLIINPFAFFLFLGLNLGLYGPGVLLIREASIRWKKGWATIITLAAGYAILEEGIALSTFFNSHAGPVGSLGFYGHWQGVSWVWTTGIIMVHVVYSISLPIVLLSLALPETRRRSLLSNRDVLTATVVLGLDVLALMLIVVRGGHFWLGVPLLLESLLAVAILTLVAYRIPRGFLQPRPGPPTVPPSRFFILGILLFPVSLSVESILAALRVPPAVIVALLVALFATLLYSALQRIGTWGNERSIIAFAFGAILPIAVFGFLASLPLPVVGVADIAAGLFLLHLWRSYLPSPSSVQPQPTHVLA